MLAHIVSGIAPMPHRQIHARGPVPRAVPIRLRKIRGDPQSLRAECVEQVAGNVGVLMGMKGAIGRGHLIIRLLGIEHAEAIVMLGGENQVAKARVLRKARPCLRLKAHGMEGAVQREILPPEARGIAFPVHIPARPARVRIRKRPGFANAPLRIAAPVHHEGQLLILEPFQAGKQQRIGWRHVVRRFAVVDDVSPRFFLCHAVPLLRFFQYNTVFWRAQPKKLPAALCHLEKMWYNGRRYGACIWRANRAAWICQRTRRKHI